MNELEVMGQRHSVRAYQERALSPELEAALRQEIQQCNAESSLHIQLVVNEPKAFSGRIAHYGKFSGVTSYLALVGKKGPGLDEACGYYGERLVLWMQRQGLNSCWVALTYDKVPGAYTVSPGEKLCLVIALGYGANQGTPHRSRPAEEVMDWVEPMPKWFRSGVEAALLAPTAMNQQKFRFIQDGTAVTAKAGLGPYTRVDLGIAKYHFELGAGKENFTWK